MNSTRPKSSKGRSRPPADHTVRGTGQHLQSDRHPAPGLRSASVTGVTPPPPQGRDNTTTTPPPRCAPARPTPSLNKYKVLPSIKKPSDLHLLEMKTSKIKLCDHVIAQQRRRHSHGDPGCYTQKTHTATRSNPEMGRGAPAAPATPNNNNRPPDPDRGSRGGEAPAVVTTTTTTDHQLLLAVRAPCGRRFQQHFAPADTLQTLIACAEARNETSYPEAFVETMDVPRRSFRRLDMTLSECCVVNRSVLCISQEASDALL